MGADNQNKSLCDTSLEGLEEYDSVDDESSEDLPPPVLRPFNEMNSDFEEGVEDLPDLECSLPPVQGLLIKIFLKSKMTHFNEKNHFYLQNPTQTLWTCRKLMPHWSK